MKCNDGGNTIEKANELDRKLARLVGRVNLLVVTTAGDKEFQMEAAKPPERFSADFVMGGVAAIMAESLLLSGEVTRAMSYDTSLRRLSILHSKVNLKTVFTAQKRRMVT
ncbi:uncharacterized protein LOC123204622 isoform X2 [Mangifera indica]|uniref:uncharacterized protein LOC123204622 isoform X2 n=1 Tax=Mangifera indica TaxID=29780 RepID=UPI001CFBA4DA|nr:uncharacterized protein LOC123204622 isoform X2 [Mangifera indica]